MAMFSCKQLKHPISSLNIPFLHSVSSVESLLPETFFLKWSKHDRKVLPNYFEGVDVAVFNVGSPFYRRKLCGHNMIGGFCLGSIIIHAAVRPDPKSIGAYSVIVHAYMCACMCACVAEEGRKGL